MSERDRTRRARGEDALRDRREHRGRKPDRRREPLRHGANQRRGDVIIDVDGTEEVVICLADALVDSPYNYVRVRAVRDRN